MDKVFQVFVSSTFSDLADERRQVTNTLAKAGYIAAGMELFPATDQQQLDFIKRVIDRSDYYAVIVAGRYGSLADDKLSFTEHEYEYALSRKIPVLAFLHAEPDKIEIGKTDKDPEKAKSLQNFRDRLSTGRLVDYWRSAPDLCTMVLTAVVQTTNLSPGIGWVRGDQAIDPKILLEAERLRSENADLKQQIGGFAGAAPTFPSDLLGPDGDYAFTLTSKTYDNRYSNKPQLLAEKTEQLSAKLGAVFVQIFEALLHNPTEHKVGEYIGAAVAALALRESTDPRVIDRRVPQTDVEQLRYHFEALGILRAEAEEGQFHSWLNWCPTDKGRQYVAYRRSIRSSEP